MNPKETIIEKKNAIVKKIESYQEFNDIINTDLLLELNDIATQFEKNANNAIEEGRLLRIGIIGQIKRGKSSFLNSLLFDSQDVLPKAATPMTAALTKISYSKEPEAIVEFYNHAEWENIEKKARAYIDAEDKYKVDLASFTQHTGKKNLFPKRKKIVSPPIKPVHNAEDEACYELHNMAIQNGLNVSSRLGTSISINGLQNTFDIIDKLNEYVGADGKFTPIVKSTELKLNIDTLKNIEIVDTPGMNDPIISRGRRTKEFIGQCDVVFFLSFCSQFLDEEDMSLLAQNIPSKGVNEIYLIGSLFDSVMLDTYKDYPSIEALVLGATSKLNHQANKNFEKIKDDSYISHVLEKSLPPTFISSRCQDIVIHNDNLSADEVKTLDLLNKMYDGFNFSQDDLIAIANFSAVREKLNQVKTKKDKIQAEKFSNVLVGYEAGYTNKLTKISDDILLKKTNLLTGDLASVKETQEAMIKKIESGQTKIEGVFDHHSIKAEKSLKKLILDIEKSSSVFSRISSKKGSELEEYQEEYTHDNGCGIFWWRSLSDNRYETRTRTATRSVTYTYANIQDAIDLLDEFVSLTGSKLFELIDTIIDIIKFRKDILNITKTLFDLSDENFDPDAILIPLGNAVERITIPNIELDVKRHKKTIEDKFTESQVRGEKIEELRREQSKVISLVLSDIKNEIERTQNDILTKLSKEKMTFIPMLTKDLANAVETLKHDLEDKTHFLERYDKLLKLLNQDLKA